MRFGNLVSCPESATTGTKEGDRPRGPRTRRASPFPCQRVLSANTEEFLQLPPRPETRAHFLDPIALRLQLWEGKQSQKGQKKKKVRESSIGAV